MIVFDLSDVFDGSDVSDVFDVSQIIQIIHMISLKTYPITQRVTDTSIRKILA